MLTIFTKRLHHRCLIGPLERPWYLLSNWLSFVLFFLYDKLRVYQIGHISNSHRVILPNQRSYKRITLENLGKRVNCKKKYPATYWNTGNKNISTVITTTLTEEFTAEISCFTFYTVVYFDEKKCHIRKVSIIPWYYLKSASLLQWAILNKHATVWGKFLLVILKEEW